MNSGNTVNILLNVEAMGLKITWKLIYLGLNGMDDCKMLSHAELLEFIDSKLTVMSRQTDRFIKLLNEEREDRAISILLEFAETDGSDEFVQKRKWRVYKLKRLLDNPSEDSLQGALELMEFWSQNDITNDCPQIFPTTEGVLAVKTYFTPQMYTSMTNANKAWLLQEIENINVVERAYLFY